MKLKTRTTAFVCSMAVGLGSLALSVSPAWSKANIMFILDVSGSMAAKLEGKRKIDLAKQAFADMVGGLPAETHAGLYAYGHYGDRDCTAFEQMISLGAVDKPRMDAEVKKLQARQGATPLTAALMKSVEAVANYESEGPKAVVLLSDGGENCGGDPVKFATWVGEKLGGLVKVYVVGFDVDDDVRAQLQAVAKAGLGAYFDAGNAKELGAALATVASQVVKTSIFEDDFDGAFLKEDWTVIGDSADYRTLADGQFVVITEPGALSND
jgi:hypothetical protein